MKHILVATDGSDDADRAVDYAAGLAKREGAELIVVNVSAYFVVVLSLKRQRFQVISVH